MRKPFYRKSHKCWYFKDSAGNFIRLDPDEETAFRLWQDMLAVRAINDNSPLAVVVEAWLQEHVHALSPERFELTAGYLASFLPFAKGLSVLEVTKGLVLKWLAAEKPGRRRKDGSYGPAKKWAKTTRRDAAQAIKRVYRWAHTEGRISRNPLASLPTPEGKPRTVMVSAEAHEKMVHDLRKCIDDRPFALYLIASKCGARPRQIREVTAKNVLPDFSAWVFDDHKTAEETGRKLVVYLPPCLATLTRILVSRQPTGPLFTNEDGRPWKRNTVSQRIRRLRKRLKLPGDLIAYGYRHTFATESLLAGNHIATVAQLLGHSDTRMVSRVYGHLDQHKQHLIEAAAKTTARRFNT